MSEIKSPSYETDEQVEQVRKLFDSVDKDGNHVLDKNEIKILLEQMNFPNDMKYKELIFLIYDTSKKGVIDFPSFLTFIQDFAKMKSNPNYFPMKMFLAFDTDGSGVLEGDELIPAFKIMKKKVKKREVKKMKMTFTEFIKYARENIEI